MSEEAQAVGAVVTFFGAATLLSHLLSSAALTKAALSGVAILTVALALLAFGVQIAAYVALAAVTGCCVLGYSLAFKSVSDDRLQAAPGSTQKPSVASPLPHSSRWPRRRQRG